MRNGRLRAVVPLHDCLGNFLRFVSHAHGSEMVSAGLAAAVRDFSYGQSRVKRYQEVAGATASSSASTKVYITQRDAYVAMGHSRTARLPEYDTKGRDSRQARELAGDPEMPAEDFVEQARNKIKFWPDARNPLGVPLWNPKHGAWAGHAAGE